MITRNSFEEIIKFLSEEYKRTIEKDKKIQDVLNMYGAENQIISDVPIIDNILNVLCNELDLTYYEEEALVECVFNDEYVIINEHENIRVTMSNFWDIFMKGKIR